LSFATQPESSGFAAMPLVLAIWESLCVTSAAWQMLRHIPSEEKDAPNKMENNGKNATNHPLLVFIQHYAFRIY
jgi:hypothetical protein